MIKTIFKLAVGIMIYLFTTGCSSSEVYKVENKTEINVKKVENIKDEDTTEAERLIEFSNGTVIKRVRFSDVGFEAKKRSQVRLEDFNTKISDLFFNISVDQSYKDNAFKEGIVTCDDNILIVGERYKGKVISSFSIGSDINEFINQYGEPLVKIDNTIFYKAIDCYFAVRGKEKIEQVAIKLSKNISYDSRILRDLLKSINEDESVDIHVLIDKDPYIKGFFENSGYVNGDFYINTEKGIEIIDYEDEKLITVFNNFDGNLYDIVDNKGDFKLIYENQDYNVEQLLNSIQDYINYSDIIENEGQVSPNGKNKYIFEIDRELNTYFRVRALDCANRDIKISTVSEVLDSTWLTDNYILYINSFQQIPFIVSVCKEPLTINVLYEIGLLDKPDNFYPDGYECKIEKVDSNKIVIGNSFDNSQIIIHYEITTDGSIKLKKVNEIEKQNY